MPDVIELFLRVRGCRQAVCLTGPLLFVTVVTGDRAAGASGDHSQRQDAVGAFFVATAGGGGLIGGREAAAGEGAYPGRAAPSQPGKEEGCLQGLVASSGELCESWYLCHMLKPGGF